MLKDRTGLVHAVGALILVCALAGLAGCGGNIAAEAPAATDTPAPSPTPREATLTLTDGNELDWPCGIPFAEPGYTATSPDGADITDKVVCRGEVDCMTPGDYTLSYSVLAGAERAEEKRIVHVTEVGYPEFVEPTEKVFYLTFDDGPCENTPEHLETLARHSAKATFFVITGNNPYLETLLPEIAEAGHSIGVHTESHVYDVLYSSSDYYLGDLMRARQSIYEITGEYVNLCRFPGGSTTAYHKLNNREKGAWDTVTAQLERMGIQYFDWNVSPENPTNNATSSLNAVKSFAPKYTVPVTLQHDTRLYSIRSVESILEWGEENGYTFLGLDTTVSPVHAN